MQSKYANQIMLDFYPGLPQIITNYLLAVDTGFPQTNTISLQSAVVPTGFSSYKDSLVFVCIHLPMKSLTKHAVHLHMLEVGRQAHKVLSKGEGKDSHHTV